MVTSAQCIERFGHPDIEMERRHMVLHELPVRIQEAFPVLPKKIYCNKLLVGPLEQALGLLIERDLACHVLTWDGCFNIRKKRGGNSWSLHSWGIAIDINAAWNGFGEDPMMPLEVVACFEEAGFEWGGYWEKKDGMHFQLRSL